MPRAELHCHSCFSFLDGASDPEALVERAVVIGLDALAITDHRGLYGVVRFAAAAEEAGIRPVIGIEIELRDAAVPDPAGIVLPRARARGRARAAPADGLPTLVAADGLPARPRPLRPRPPGHREPLREDLRGIGSEELGPHLVLLARDQAGYRSLCRLVSHANLAGTKGVPRFTHALLAEHTEGLVALSGGRDGEIARRLRVGDRDGARRAAERYAQLFAAPGTRGGITGAGLALELQHHLLPDDDWLVAETVALADELGLPAVVTNDVRYARPEGRELHDVVTAIRHGRTLETLGPLRSPDGESWLKSEEELLALPPADPRTGSLRIARAWREGLENAGELAMACSVDLGFERYRFPGFPVPRGETAFSYLETLCHEGARRRYHPMTPAVVRQLAHELTVVERTGLAEFFLICWDLMRFAKERRIPAQGRGSAADSIIAYVLGITRVDPIRHELLFERFINEGRTTYPDVDIDFSSARREEVIQYVYERYGPEHTGMVANLVTYRARSAVRQVGLALGFPAPLVDRVAKALDTWDAGSVRRDLEADPELQVFFTQATEPAGGVEGTPPTEEQARRLRREAGSASRPAVRSGGRSDDEGGPGDTPVSEAHIAGVRSARAVERIGVDGRLEGQLPPAGSDLDGQRSGSVAGLSPWDRWLELAARIDGFPRHLGIHSGGMLVTAAPLIDIAPLERATMPGRVVVQFDKRDVEALKLIKLDLLSLGMLAAIDETVSLIERDCATCLDLDRLPESIPEVFEMLSAADTVGVFQVESRAQMQTLPKSRPSTLDDLVVEVAIIRPGPIQGNAVHPYLRRKQGIEPVAYLHPSLAPILHDTLGVILYQEQVMRIAIEVAGFTPGESDGFRRAMGAKRSSAEMEKLHARFIDGCIERNGLEREVAEELFRQVAAFASFGFAKSHAAAFARTAYESSFLKLFYPAQLLVGLINAQPMGFYPVEVLVNDAKRHGVEVLPVDVNASGYRTTTEWVGPEAQPKPVVSSGCIVPSEAARRRWAADSAVGCGVRLGLHLVPGIGEEHGARLDEEFRRGPYATLRDVVVRTELPGEVIERLIRAGALDSLGRPRRELLWQLREITDASRPRPAAKRTVATPTKVRETARTLDLGLPPTDAPALPPLGELERIGDSYAVLSLDARRQVVSAFRERLGRFGVATAASLADRRPGPVRVAGLVVTRQHPMTAMGMVFLALEDETGMANITLWPDTWDRERHTIRRHALLVIEGTLQRESNVVNVVAKRIRPLVEIVEQDAAGSRGTEPPSAGSPGDPRSFRSLGYAGTRRTR